MPHSVHTSPAPALPYWQVNVPPAQRTKQCPDFLLDQSEKNQRILSTPDADYRRQSWEEVREIVKSNRLGLLQRLPSDLRRYLAYIHSLQKTYGSVLSFVQHERLNWPTTVPSGNPPFTDPADYKVLYNDWPYGIDEDITHLVVWTKFVLEDEAGTDDLTERAKGEVEEFVERTFCCAEGGLEKGHVIWFKNWRSLKSVHALEHFHVMVYRADNGFLERVTGGDRSMSDKLREEGS